MMPYIPETETLIFTPSLDERWIARFAEWNLSAFGPGLRTAGTLDHIRKECAEIEADPTDHMEWVDIVLLAINGLVRLGHSPASIISEIRTKHRINELRKWPDWRETDPEKAIEHHKEVGTPLATRSIQRTCRECGIDHIPPGTEIDGEPLCWAENDLCSRCQDYIQSELVRDAGRYRFLRREWPIDLDNTITSGEALDRAIDTSLGLDVSQTETMERRLADCLATCIDEPLLKGFLGGDGRIPTEVRLGFFRPEIADRAAALLEEAGR